MPKSTLTGSRIRERRQALTMRQAELARKAGISASYLNLIEHNRRRIAGKVLIDIARALEVDVTTLTEGAEESLLEALREAAAVSRRGGAELERIEEFVSRFPGWARLIAGQRRRLVSQERAIEALNDRLTHDPFLAESLHALLSNVTAIQSTSAILVETPGIEPQWRDRFTRNIHEESSRLAQSSKALVGYFEDQVQAETPFTTPLEALDAHLVTRGYHVPELEGHDTLDAVLAVIGPLVDDAVEIITPQARALAHSYFEIYARQALRMPAEAVIAAWKEDPNPASLARRFDVPLSHAMQRVGVLPADRLGEELGLVVSDAAGAILFRKALDGFPVPRYGAACAIWPIFDALARPFAARHHWLETPPGRRFEAWTMAEPIGPAGFEAPPILRASMLVARDRGAVTTPEVPPLAVGTTCRICPRPGCLARREASIMQD